jgi:hypothetical protein
MISTNGPWIDPGPVSIIWYLVENDISNYQRKTILEVDHEIITRDGGSKKSIFFKNGKVLIKKYIVDYSDGRFKRSPHPYRVTYGNPGTPDVLSSTVS